jgi:hypothetical protein
MATREPCIDPNCGWFQARQDRFESQFFPDGIGLDEHQQSVIHAYRESSPKPFVRSVVRAAKRLGINQQQLAAWLDLHHSVISVAANYGSLGIQPLVALLADFRVLKEVVTRFPAIPDRMGRAGFIGAALCAAKNVGGTRAPTELTAIDYELVCSVIDIQGESDPGEPIPIGQAGTIIANALREIRVQEDSPSAELLQRLQSEDFAAGYLAQLQSRWIDIFVHTLAIVEDLAALPMPRCPGARLNRRRRRPREASVKLIPVAGDFETVRA